MIKVALADDHVMLRKSLAIMINMLDGVQVAFEADNGAALLDLLQREPEPDIILLDITMPVMDGFETAKWIRRHYPNIKVLALTMLSNAPVILHMVKNGVRGYLLKDCELSQLQTALYEVYEKGYYFNEYFTPGIANEKAPYDKVILNGQELVFLRWCCTEFTHKEIAEEMKISPRTVDGYRDTLFKKLRVNSRVGLVIYAIKHGFVQI